MPPVHPTLVKTYNINDPTIIQIKNNGAINLNHELKFALAIAIAPTVAPSVGVIKLPKPPPKDNEVKST